VCGGGAESGGGGTATPVAERLAVAVVARAISARAAAIAAAGRAAPLSVSPGAATCRVHVIAQVNGQAIGAEAMAAELRLACQHADLDVLTEVTILVMVFRLVCRRRCWATDPRSPARRLHFVGRIRNFVVRSLS